MTRRKDEPIIYLASPYSHPKPEVREWRYERACEVAALLMSDGHLVYSPIAHSHPLTRHGLPTNWEYWRAMDEAMLSMCQALVVVRLSGWEQSRGVQAELSLARELGLRIGGVEGPEWSLKWEEVPEGDDV